jgi:hypothetical protein
VAAVRRRWPRFLVARVLELGSPCANVEPLLVAAGSDREAAARDLIGQALDCAQRDRARMIVVQDVVGPALAAILRAEGFVEVSAPPTVVLALRWRTFEEYLTAMRHRYRRRARCVLRDSAHLRVEPVADFGPLAGELAALWRLVYDRATETRRELLTPGFFAAAAVLPQTEALLLRRPDGTLAAFGLLLADRPWLHFLQCGFERRAGREEGAYFRLLLEIVRVGIERGFERVNLGATTLGPKLDLGGQPVPLCAWIRHRNPAVQRAFAFGAGRWFREPPVTARHVFAA